ncbi:ecto-NOX disulfide-thiol exchanger 2-like, partial [Maniola hyperantus]|uniref:ecto-NOX disulfide-thiol exchanger 2-like n=1 Tax=Aphantopus hyperantus TaxID=2795564 RepID=UPI0037482D87
YEYYNNIVFQEVDNIKEEFNAIFDEDEVEKPNKNSVSLEKYEELKKENESLTYELEGYKNEAYLAKDEAERKFEKFKAHYIAQQALQQKSVFPPLPQQKIEPPLPPSSAKPLPPPPTPDDDKVMISGPSVPPTEAKLISILTSFLMVHPLGASLDYLVSYVRSMAPNVTQATVLSTLQKYGDIFNCETTGVGACIEHRWYFVTFDIIKREK